MTVSPALGRAASASSVSSTSTYASSVAPVPAPAIAGQRPLGDVEPGQVHGDKVIAPVLTAVVSTSVRASRSADRRRIALVESLTRTRSIAVDASAAAPARSSGHRA